MISSGNNNSSFEFLDAITIYSAILQTMDYQMTVEQSTNDELMKEMRQRLEALLQEIIKQNNEILCKLNQLMQG